MPVCWWTILRDFWTTVPLARDTPTPPSRRSLSSSKRCELIGNRPQSPCPCPDWELASKYLFPGAAKRETATHSSYIISKRNSGPGAVFQRESMTLMLLYADGDDPLFYGCAPCSKSLHCRTFDGCDQKIRGK